MFTPRNMKFVFVGRRMSTMPLLRRFGGIETGSQRIVVACFGDGIYRICWRHGKAASVPDADSPIRPSISQAGSVSDERDPRRFDPRGILLFPGHSRTDSRMLLSL